MRVLDLPTTYISHQARAERVVDLKSWCRFGGPFLDGFGAYNFKGRWVLNDYFSPISPLLLVGYGTRD